MILFPDFDLAAIADGILSFIIGIVYALLKVLFFWLPDDPFKYYLDSVTLGGLEEGISWLNWFIDFSPMIVALGLVVSAVMLWAGWRVITSIYKVFTQTVELAPLE